LPAFGRKLISCYYIMASLPTLGISIFAIYSLFPPLNSSIMATVNMDSVQFYQPPFMTPLFGRKYSTSLLIDHEPPAAPRHKKGSQVLESFGAPALDGWDDFGLQHNSGRDQDAVSEDDFPTLEALLCPTLRKQVSKATKHTLQTADQRPLLRSSSCVNIAQSRFKDLGDSQGRSINSALPPAKQPLTMCRETSCS
jgi:hypothetical protein